jgi:hypothetical protein
VIQTCQITKIHRPMSLLTAGKEKCTLHNFESLFRRGLELS